jgi:hypothetical protein
MTDLPPRPAAKQYGIGSATKIDLSGGATVLITRGAPGSLTVSASPEDQERVDVKVDGDWLRIHYKGGLIFNRGPQDELRYEITIPVVEEVRLSDGIQVQATGFDGKELKLRLNNGTNLALNQVQVEELEVELHSGAVFTGSGSAGKQKVKAGDGANYQGGGIASRESEIEASSGANVIVNVTEKLKARAASGSIVSYIGDKVQLDVRSDAGALIRPISPNQ